MSLKLLALSLGGAEIPAREAVLVTSWVGVVLHLPGVVSSRAGGRGMFSRTRHTEHSLCLVYKQHLEGQERAV